MSEVKISAFMAMSLDGYIAGPEGDLAWLDEANNLVPEGEDCGYGNFFDKIDLLVMGRHTFEKVMSFGAWPYGNKSVWVLSSSELDNRFSVPDGVKRAAGSPKALYQAFQDGGYEHVYVDGGLSTQNFLKAGLLDELTVTLIPVVLGEGISMFSDLDDQVELELLMTRSYDFGFVQAKYRVQKH